MNSVTTNHLVTDMAGLAQGAGGQLGYINGETAIREARA